MGGGIEMSVDWPNSWLGIPGARCALHERKLGTVRDAFFLFERLQGEAFCWWLDSAAGNPADAGHSFMGADPYAVLRVRGDDVEVDCLRAVRSDLEPGRTLLRGDPLATLRTLLPRLPARHADRAACGEAPFVGGAVGYLGYEFGSQVEDIAFHTRDDLGLADAVVLLVDQVLVIDHRDDALCVFGLGFGESHGEATRAAREAAARGATWAEGIKQRAGPPRTAPHRRPPHPEVSRVRGLRADFDAHRYAKSVALVREEIRAGNCYQANLTQRMDLPFEGDPLALYQSLRTQNPAPFGAFLQLPEVTVLSSSPERFLRVTPDGIAESSPIKGTRPREVDLEADAKNARELLHSAKDRAENLMIVDLVRNDLGRVCEPGSVEVPSLMRAEAFATVHHLVSTIRGLLRPECDALDALAASFPPGSMTGAPKIAAMRLLDRLEPVRRAVYSGALGYFDVRGGVDLSVVIRTLLLKDGRAYLHVGGGVVMDSDPEAEYRESLDKARALLAVLDAFSDASSGAEPGC